MGILINLVCAFVAWKTYSFAAALRSVNYIPGMRPPFSPLSLFGAILPTSWWNPGLNWPWELRKTDVVKQLLGNEGKTHLVKPEELTSALLLWGDNLVSANGEMWKRHRRILAPTFTPTTYSLVVKETIATYKEMIINENWDGKDSLFISGFNRIPLRFALIIIARCGFGLPMSWTEEQPGTMSFGEALAVVSETAIPRLILPNWVYKLPIKKLKDLDRAWATLAKFMHEFVDTRRQDIANDRETFVQRGDLFTRLVEAYDGEGKLGLEEQEVIGNTFTFMFAGHETTACGLNATLGFLAIYQEEQEKAYREILDTIPAGEDPTIENITKLRHVLACFNEALRIYPAGVMLTRDVPVDIPLKVARPVEKTIVLKAGSRMIIDMVGIHHNPHTFPNPDKFIPSRWYEVPEHDVSIFGAGPRACIGRKFSHTEALTFLALFLREWKIDIVLAEGESREVYEERVMGKAGRVGLAFGVGEISLKLTRRVALS
ncbi:hypothetical protein Clacol_001144 [Clathrus columnatus]|uniref:Cytochrome P450 n=1 Tax=Clathrus columnatus TaxID=1419009 RepID=A0AAV5A0D2_9AGAM|nr:hypothetical protein Clacol_001144 [Clathrus columnatus]